ncbi:MAG: hypothetical protein AAGH88_03565 [Planctomycetota bacterium]
MTNRTRYARPLIWILMLLLCVPALAQDDADQPTRKITVEAIGFEVTVPSSCKLELNERVRGSSFLKAQFTLPDGRPMPANLSFIYSVAPPGEPLRQLDDRDAYLRAWLVEMKPIYADIEAVNVVPTEHSGLRGFLIEYTHTVRDIPVRARQYNLVQPDGSGRFIFTYGTVQQLWAGDSLKLEAILDTVVIKPSGEAAPQN